MVRPCLALTLILLLAACSGEEFSSSGTGGAAGSSGGGSGGVGGKGGADGGLGAVTCETLRAAGSTQSGVQALRTAGGKQFLAHCEMTVAGGGWTLVARSVEAAPDDATFGWRFGTGAPDNPSLPYSLNLSANGFVFTEILLAQRDGGYGIVKGFVAKVPLAFLKTYAQLPYLLTPAVKVVVGDCPLTGTVSMLAHVGYTDRNNAYYVRDNTELEAFGLLSDGWKMGEDTDCNYNADMNGKQGMIFVR